MVKTLGLSFSIERREARDNNILFYEEVKFMEFMKPLIIIPEWIRQLDTTEKVVAYLEFCGREDLIIKLKTKGFLYLSELLSAGEPRPWDKDWYYDSVEHTDFIDFIDFGMGEES